MAYKIVNGPTFNQDIDETSTYQEAPLGTRVQAVDLSNPTRGTGEFVYCLGAASTAAGDLVTIDGAGFTTTRASANAKGKVGVAMSANVASQYGWYCVDGTVPITSGDVADGAVLYLTATAGSVDDAAVVGDLIYGAFSVAADAGGTTLSSITHPFVTDASN